MPRARESNSTVVLRVSEALASRVGFWGVLVFGVGGVVVRRCATTRCRRPKAFGFGSPRPAPRSGFEFFVSWCHALWAPELGRYTAPKGRELGARALVGVPLRLGLACSKALGPRRASSNTSLGARGSGALSGSVGACNQALQATQSRRVHSLPYRWRLVALLAVATGLRAA